MKRQKRRKPYDKPFGVGRESDRVVFSLEEDGIDCVPLFGYNHHLVAKRTAGFHAHHECVEVIFCLRGDGLYQCGDKEYPLRAGSVFVSAPEQLHRLKLYHKGLRMYWIQFRLPTRGFPILGLREDESDWLASKLKGIPLRLFAGGSELKTAFGRLFRVYDEEKDETTITIYGDPKSYAQIQKFLEEQGFEEIGGEFTYIPNDTKDVDAEQRATLDKMVEKLEEFDDVQNVYTNMKPEGVEE